MKLKKLSLTNFRSFAETQTINFAPVTLLYGQNSVGKSSILMALAYVQHILEKGNCDPKQLDALGGKSVGGFKSLVHGKSLKFGREIVIRLDFDTTGSLLGDDYSSYAESLFEQIESNVDSELFGGMKERLRIGSLLGVYDHFAIQLTMACRETEGYGAYVKSYEVFFDNQFFARIDSIDLEEDAYITRLNLAHTFFDSSNTDFIVKSLSDITPVVKSAMVLVDENYNVAPFKPHSDVTPVVKSAIVLVDENYDAAPLKPLAIKPIKIKPFAEAIPKPGRLLQTNFKGAEPKSSSEHYHNQVFTRLLSQAFVWPLDAVLSYLQKSAFIGPLRIIPSDSFEPNPYPEQGDWFDGTAAWDLLYEHRLDEGGFLQEDDPMFEEIKFWFYAKELLNTGYIMQRIITKEENANYALDNDQLDVLAEDHFMENITTRPRLLFYDKKTNTALTANQMGVGLSQVMPLVVAAHAVKSGIVSIEQPELHIHPAFQVQLGDLFTQHLNLDLDVEIDVSKSQRPMFLIETHSEHIMLRLLRRIRETTDGELKEGIVPVKPEDISVVYLEPAKDDNEQTDQRQTGIKVTHLEIDEDGEFVQRWPKGFFAERRQELM
jgi:hypothetical protein